MDMNMEVTTEDVKATSIADSSPLEESENYDYYYEFSYLADPQYAYPIYITFAVGIVGVLANGFVLLVLLGFATMKKSAGILLVLHQTLTDLISSALLLITVAVYVTQDGKLEGALGDFLCKCVISETFFWVAFVASSFSLVSITIERYMMIAHPVFHRNHFSKRLVAIFVTLDWVLAAIFLIPNSLVAGVQEKWCTYYRWPSKGHEKAYGYVYFLGTFMAPVLILVYGYGRMIFVLIVKMKSVQPEGAKSQLKMSKSQLNITITMIAVAVVYVICLLPYQLYYLLFIVVPLPDRVIPYYTLLIISQINCCVNPFIYAVKFEAFKSGVRKMFGCKNMNSDVSVTQSTG